MILTKDGGHNGETVFVTGGSTGKAKTVAFFEAVEEVGLVEPH